MGEFHINPVHNVHKKYRQVNFVNPYIFTPPVVVPVENTFIGGVASTIPTASSLATRLGISVGAISNFTIVGSDIKCKIIGGYSVVGFGIGDPVTSYYDYDGLVTSIGVQAFYNTYFETGYFPNATSISTGAFDQNISGFNKLKFLYIPNVSTIGNTVGNDGVFRSGNLNQAIIYAKSSLATVNSGGVEGDLAYLAGGNTVRYVTNFTAPSPITNLSIGNVYNTAIQLNFTPPSATNTIEWYEVYVNGVFNNKITASSGYATGLTASTSYNITIYARDVLYNKSLVSNTVTQSTSSAAWDISTGLLAYYKKDSNSNDGFGVNNGIDTSVTYGSGKVGNAGIYNGSTSKTLIGNPSNLQISNGTISCWIKTSGAGASYRSIFGKTQAYNMFLVDGVFGIYSWAGGSGFKSTGVNLNDGLWHHVAFVFESGTANNYLYIDGVLKLTTSMTIATQSDNFCIGSSNSIQYINGTIDEASVYNVKLTQAQIQLIYNNGTGITL